MRQYVKNGYQVTESEPIRIGTSRAYIFERVEIELDKNGTPDPEQGVYSRIIFAMWGDGGSSEIDACELPSKSQAVELVKFFSKYM